jgi:hypothetical protein
MPEIQERFGELRVFDERLLIELNGVRRQAALLADQAGVVIQLGSRRRESNKAVDANLRLGLYPSNQLN